MSPFLASERGPPAPSPARLVPATASAHLLCEFDPDRKPA